MPPSRHPKSLSRRHLLKAGLAAGVTLSTWPLARPYVKNYAPNPTFNYGGRAAALWLER